MLKLVQRIQYNIFRAGVEIIFLSTNYLLWCGNVRNGQEQRQAGNQQRNRVSGK